jgi:hypothetical protein
MSGREGSDTRRLHVDSFKRFTPQQRAAWIDQEREDERLGRTFLQEAEERLSQRSKIGREQERSIVFEWLARSTLDAMASLRTPRLGRRGRP